MNYPQFLFNLDIMSRQSDDQAEFQTRSWYLKFGRQERERRHQLRPPHLQPRHHLPPTSHPALSCPHGSHCCQQQSAPPLTTEHDMEVITRDSPITLAHCVQGRGWINSGGDVEIRHQQSRWAVRLLPGRTSSQLPWGELRGDTTHHLTITP